MKNYIKFMNVVLVIALIFFLSGCSNKSTEKNQNRNSDSNNVSTDASLSEDNFEWDDNIITALTETGAKQKALVIPTRCEGFNGMIFADIENRVTSVSFESDKDLSLNGVFGGAKNIKSIELPANLTEIAAQDFWLCSSLKEIIIPSEVVTIGAYAFQKNTSLTTVKFEGEVTNIKAHAFDGCTSLKEVALPDSITLIEEYAFYECIAMETIQLPVSLSVVGEFAFANSGLSEIMVPSDVTLSEYATTSFVQADHEITVNISEGSWMDKNFDNVFNGAFKKGFNK